MAALAEDIGLAQLRPYALGTLGQRYAELGDRQRAAGCYRQTLTASQTREPRKAAVIQVDLEHQISKLGETAEARKLWQDGLPYLAEAGEPLAAQVAALLAAARRREQPRIPP